MFPGHGDHKAERAEPRLCRDDDPVPPGPDRGSGERGDELGGDGDGGAQRDVDGEGRRRESVVEEQGAGHRRQDAHLHLRQEGQSAGM